MSAPTVEHAFTAPDFPGLETRLRDAVGQLEAATPDAAECAVLLREVEALARLVERAQMIAARAADRACITRLGAPGAGPDGGSGDGRSEYASTANYLSRNLRITAAEAKKRLEAADVFLPQRSLTGQDVPPRYPVLARSVESGEVSVETARMAARYLSAVAPVADWLPDGGAEVLEAMEANLAQTATRHTPETVRQVAEKWARVIDQDGAEPSEKTKRRNQGLFDRGRKFGMRYFELFTDDLQAEALLSACGPEANPRTGSRDDGDTTDERQPHGGARTAEGGTSGSSNGKKEPSGNTEHSGTNRGGDIHGEGNHAGPHGAADACAATEDGERVPAPEDPRSRAQKLLDGLVAAVGIALSTTRLPRNGGLRPQVMVTIDHQTLLGQLAGFGRATSEAMLAGPIHPGRIRQLACDADIIPLVLAGEGQVLDVGRAQRLFTETQKKALYARDRGCTFPGCTMPALWTEAHHVDWWSRGGPTSVDNGACICSFHHHLVHAGNWEIDMVNGVPYWIPPAYVDPGRRRLRNIYFHPEIRDALFTV